MQADRQLDIERSKQTDRQADRHRHRRKQQENQADKQLDSKTETGKVAYFSGRPVPGKFKPLKFFPGQDVLFPPGLLRPLYAQSVRFYSRPIFRDDLPNRILSRGYI